MGQAYRNVIKVNKSSQLVDQDTYFLSNTIIPRHHSTIDPTMNTLISDHYFFFPLKQTDCQDLTSANHRSFVLVSRRLTTSVHTHAQNSINVYCAPYRNPLTRTLAPKLSLRHSQVSALWRQRESHKGEERDKFNINL